MKKFLFTGSLVFSLFACSALQAAPDEKIAAAAREAKPAVISTLKEIVEIESGSRDIEGLNTLAQLLQKKFTALGGKVELLDETDLYKLHDTPVRTGPTLVARFQGTGKTRIMLLAHMDTVYQRGTLAKLPFRIEGNLAYGPGIADDKGGIANIIHAIGILNAAGERNYGTLTVVINGDEEISTPGARKTITRIASEHDVVISCEPTSIRGDAISLATSGIGAALINVKGKSAHAGVNPEDGRNALIELSHQILATRNLSVPEKQIKFNWTVSKAGTTRNVIPDEASAAADVRVQRVSDLDIIEKSFRAAIQPPMVEGTKVEASFENRRPPLEVTDASRAVARLAQSIYGELGRTLAADESGKGGGTDAAFAAFSGKVPVVESFGYSGWNYHSNEAEYIDLNSIEPRLYLLTRMVQSLSKGVPTK